MKPDKVTSFFNSGTGQWLFRAHWFTDKGYSSKTFATEHEALNADLNTLRGKR